MVGAARWWRLVSFTAIAAAFVVVGGWSATGGIEPDPGASYTGCLDTKGKGVGKLSKIKEGPAPIGDACPAQGFLMVHFFDGDITGVAAGPGLTDGGTIGDIQLAIDPTFRLPQSCATGQVSKWDETTNTWTCAADLDTSSTYTAGTGLMLDGSMFAVDTPFLLPQSCASNQVAKWEGVLQEWACANDVDTNTTYGAGTGLALSGSNFSIDAAYRLPQGCSTNEIPKWNGAAWVCQTPTTGPGILSMNGVIGTSIPAGSNAYVFIGPTTTIVTNGAQRITGSMTAILGTTLTPSDFDFGLCRQAGSGTITNFADSSFMTTFIDNVPQPYAASASIVPGAGTWKVGFCVRNTGTADLNFNDFVNGWFMLTG